MKNELLRKILGSYMTHNEDMHDLYIEVMEDCGQLVDYVHFLEQAYRDMVNERADADDALAECEEELTEVKEEKDFLAEKVKKLKEEVLLLSKFFVGTLLENSMRDLERAETIADEFNKFSAIKIEIKPSMAGNVNFCWLTSDDVEYLIEYKEDIEEWH